MSRTLRLQVRRRRLKSTKSIADFKEKKDALESLNGNS